MNNLRSGRTGVHDGKTALVLKTHQPSTAAGQCGAEGPFNSQLLSEVGDKRGSGARIVLIVLIVLFNKYYSTHDIGPGLGVD